MPVEDPEIHQDAPLDRKDIWLRGLWMLVLVILFGIAETVLVAVALIQFFWMLFAKEKNRLLVEFGESLGEWLKKTAEFQSGRSEDKPFPWTSWKS